MTAHNTIEFADHVWKHGFTMTPNHVLDAEGLSAGAKLTFVLLMKFGRQEGRAFPGQRRMAEAVGCTEKTLRAYIAELVASQLVDVKRRGRGVTNLYILHPDREIRAVKNASSGSVNITAKEYAVEEDAEDHVTLEGGSGGKPLDAADAVASVWSHYVAVMQPRRTAISYEEAQVIAKALAVASEDECRTCIDHCAASDYHMKRGSYSDRPGGKYNALSQILRGRRGKETTRERIDWWLDRDESAHVSGSPTVPSERDVKINRALRDIRRAVEGTQDSEVIEDAERARTFLRENGIEWTEGDGEVRLGRG